MGTNTTPPKKTKKSRTTPRGQDPKGPRYSRRDLALVAALLTVFLALVGTRLFAPEPAAPEEITLTELLVKVADGDIERVEISDETRTIVATPEGAGEDPDPAEQYSAGYTYPYSDDLIGELRDAGVEVDAAPAPEPPGLLASLGLSLIPMLLLMGFIGFLLMRKGGLGPNTSLRRSNPVEVPATRFTDVAGQTEAVEDLTEITEFLHNPERYRSVGAKMPTGVLLVGPPGTGKTLIARAVAGEAGVPFFSLSGSDFVETFVGVGAARMRQVFDKARKHGKAIIFIDELDAIGRARSAAPQGGAEEREGTLNQLLVEMDGFAEHSIIVLGATNRPDVLDPALLRPGRFDRQVVVPAPDRRGRLRILEMYGSKLRLADDVDLDDLARRTTGFTGAELSNLINESAIVAARDDSETITAAHTEDALQTVALGRARRSAQVTDRDREITAWHEAGHTVCALTSELLPDPAQVTIVPRGASGGATWSQGSDDQFDTASELRAQLAAVMGGRAAEEVLLSGDHTPGASDDFRQATRIATKMVCEWGMSPLGVARIDPDSSDGELTHAVHTEVAKMLEAALDEARRICSEHSELLADIANTLLVEETLGAEQLRELADKAARGPADRT